VIFVDASAIVAMLTEEAEGDELADRLAGYSGRVTSALAIFEATLAIARKGGLAMPDARALVGRFLVASQIAVMPLDAALGDAALDAFDRFGKGRHPARLNMGDCFAYACARTQGAPLLFKGDDFSQTDIEAA